MLIGIAAVSAAAASLDPDWITDPSQRGVTIATLPCATADQANSSGIVVDDRTIVTVAHAIHGSRDVAVRDAFGRWHRPELIRLDLERDLAVLYVGDLRATRLDRADRRPTNQWKQLPVTMLDAAASGTVDAAIVRRVRITTEVVGDRSSQAERSGYEVELDIGPGDSGAGLVDANGDLVALVFARSTSRSAIAWATAADEIDDSPGPVASWPCDPAFDAELVLSPPRLR